MDQNSDPAIRRYKQPLSISQRVFLGFLIAFAVVILFRTAGILPIDINALLARTCS